MLRHHEPRPQPAQRDLRRLRSGGDLSADEVDQVAHGLLGSDLIGFSSMTGYADLTHRIIPRVRELDPDVSMIWGGIHAIIHPEDAITADVAAICTGEGEFAFQQFFDAFRDGRDPTGVGTSGSSRTRRSRATASCR